MFTLMLIALVGYILYLVKEGDLSRREWIAVIVISLLATIIGGLILVMGG